MRRETQVVVEMPECAEVRRLAALEKLHADIDAFLPRARNVLSLYTPDVSCRKISHPLYDVTGIISSLRKRQTLNEGPSFDMSKINILSNYLGECVPILDKMDTGLKLDNQSLSGESSDRFTADEVVEATRILHACFHTVSEVMEDAKTKKTARDAAR
jgi:hypothetical protein